MSFLKRLGYYLGGFSVGLVILAFILSQKNFSCSYGPNARVLKNIRSKRIQYAESVSQMINTKVLDTGELSHLLNYGDVNFSDSDTKAEPCRSYRIEGVSNKDRSLVLDIENCDSIATFREVRIE